jgi:hypothetical protein
MGSADHQPAPRKRQRRARHVLAALGWAFMVGFLAVTVVDPDADFALAILGPAVFAVVLVPVCIVLFRWLGNRFDWKQDPEQEK